LPSAEFGAFGGALMPPSDSPHKARARTSRNKASKTDGKDIVVEETINLSTVDEFMQFPGSLQEPLEREDTDVSETLELTGDENEDPDREPLESRK
jgi:hypothetical protein